MVSSVGVTRRASGARRVTSWVLFALALASTARAQQWNDPRALALVRQATDRRARQLADSGLVDYRATAHGYLTFLAQLGEGFREPPQVVKADELALQLYWRTPNLSKQRIIGRRDTTLLPTDIDYHRDHLGIVQNNFPAIIRLGDGDEVKDVPHPLSFDGLALYDFAVSDSLRITIPGRAINVYEVKVRPRDDREARVIGALYLDRDNGQVVRMALSFTRAAFKDKLLEDLFVVLENGLVGAQFWLPRRQDIEIRRTANWMDYPVRGIIRGRWEIADYELNPGLPISTFAGNEIVQAPAAEQGTHKWPSARILDSLPPDVRAVTADEIRRVQAEVRALVRSQALRRVRGAALAGRGISDFARFNRVEGLAFGAGLTWRLGGGVSISGTGRYGIDDREAKGRVDLTWQSASGQALRLYGSADHRDASVVAERSRLVNSIAAQEFGSDFTDPVRARAAGAAFSALARGLTWTLDVGYEQQAPLSIRAVSATGRFPRLIAADSVAGLGARLSASRPTTLWFGGVELRADLQAGASMRDDTLLWTGVADLELQRPIRDSRVVARTILGGARRSGGPPAQDLVYLGGPVTAPGYGFHALVDDVAFSQRVELRVPSPFPAISLGRFGTSAARITVAPFAAVVGLRRSGLYPSAGVGALWFFDLLRVDVARGFRNGRWTWSIDASRAFWSVL